MDLIRVSIYGMYSKKGTMNYGSDKRRCKKYSDHRSR